MSTSTNQPPDHVIQVENLSKSFGDIHAVVDLTFSVRKGEIFGFLGPNGAGKTTTLSILEGLRWAGLSRIRPAVCLHQRQKAAVGGLTAEYLARKLVGRTPKNRNQPL